MGLSARNQNIQQDEVSLILNTSEMFSEAIKSDIGIEPTETLIAYISIDWPFPPGSCVIFNAKTFIHFSG